MGQILDGKIVAASLKEETAAEANKLRDNGVIPKLTIVRVGANPSDLSYERGALKRMEGCNIATEVKELPEDINQEDFIKALKEVNDDKTTHGILLFRPLPKQLDEEVIKYVIAPEKDVDCLSPTNVAKVMEGDKSGFAPCTPTAVMETLKYYNVDLKGAETVVLGRSMVVGKPVSMLLLGENATVTICHSRTKDLSSVTSKADVLVVGIGRAKMVTSEYVKEGAIVVDVGINVDENGKLCGDVDFDQCIEKASLITPVPGGVGSVTTSVLAKHVIKACKLQS
ncbi:bifunctional 5,10-methylene-tetrahydrofolate dehydrogenase/5,10-methylene-tetrahydrofolate cyclohydrolase [Alkalibaculum sp. M08DMB]|uniref:Bifunctional protein FolD n=1 Tax=Alkalibaculum sporogenes TaxID=2655001 RepID=A0A6A7KBP4_9FIRM|nr:tetrahydrofolate dehydrogenase/cyclohydrolase catalytic domain-containing protein [Alkalibaculum sporogenes]MPW26607.1 bifunctional 5,10-methylene-tetrahydrofolate dehydrogenase/5,10-methylene-tetrahydrofolate cyclohydrolase [Alkalibaculum sporogenes]